jgi:hypothetical protein
MARSRVSATGPDRGDAREVGGQGADAHLEADLVVSLSGGAVRHGRRAEGARGADEVLDDDGPGEAETSG